MKNLNLFSIILVVLLINCGGENKNFEAPWEYNKIVEFAKKHKEIKQLKETTKLLKLSQNDTTLTVLIAERNMERRVYGNSVVRFETPNGITQYEYYNSTGFEVPERTAKKLGTQEAINFDCKRIWAFCQRDTL